MPNTYYKIIFEDASADSIIMELMQKVPKYNHITGGGYTLIGYVKGMHNSKEIIDKVTDVVHDFNGGLWCDVTVVTEESIDHLL